MKLLSNYILEKLKISKNTKAEFSPMYTDKEKDFFFKTDIDTLSQENVCYNTSMPDITEDMILKNLDRVKKLWESTALGKFKPFIFTSKLKNKKGENTLWYAIYCYLYCVGPKTKKEILNFLKPGSPSQYAELFSMGLHVGLFDYNSKGHIYTIKHPNDWGF